MSQSSLNSSVFDSRSLQYKILEPEPEDEPEEEVDEESEEEPDELEQYTESELSISTEPSLLSLLPSVVSFPQIFNQFIIS